MADPEKAKENLGLYGEYNRTLRTWFVGFGFGVPAIFIVNDGAQATLVKSASGQSIVLLFLLGAGAQAAMALINKVIAWSAYRTHRSDDAGRLAKAIAKAEDWFLVDVIFDFATVVFFAWSTLLLFKCFFP